MKKGLSIFTLMFVNIILLAGILIPHHHHEDDVCFIDLQTHECCDSHSHNDESHEHDADAPINHHNCIMDQEIVLPSNQINLQDENFIYIDKQSDFEGFYAIIPDLNLPGLQPPNKIIAHAPLIREQYYRLVIGSSGLRAPPSC